MLVLMTAPYLVVRAISSARHRDSNVRSAAAVGLGLLFTFTGIGHFMQTESMAQMLPPDVPQKLLLVYLTGALEFILAAGFFVPATRTAAGWAAIVLLVLFFPVNVYAAINRIPVGGHAWGPVYLLIRAPLQTIILLWAYYFAVRPGNAGNEQQRP
jgi:uncharacterized membrane protein